MANITDQSVKSFLERVTGCCHRTTRSWIFPQIEVPASLSLHMLAHRLSMLISTQSPHPACILRGISIGGTSSGAQNWWEHVVKSQWQSSCTGLHSSQYNSTTIHYNTLLLILLQRCYTQDVSPSRIPALISSDKLQKWRHYFYFNPRYFNLDAEHTIIGFVVWLPQWLTRSYMIVPTYLIYTYIYIYIYIRRKWLTDSHINAKYELLKLET